MNQPKHINHKNYSGLPLLQKIQLASVGAVESPDAKKAWFAGNARRALEEDDLARKATASESGNGRKLIEMTSAERAQHEKILEEWYRTPEGKAELAYKRLSDDYWARKNGNEPEKLLTEIQRQEEKRIINEFKVESENESKKQAAMDCARRMFSSLEMLTVLRDDFDNNKYQNDLRDMGIRNQKLLEMTRNDESQQTLDLLLSEFVKAREMGNGAVFSNLATLIDKEHKPVEPLQRVFGNIVYEKQLNKQH